MRSSRGIAVVGILAVCLPVLPLPAEPRANAPPPSEAPLRDGGLTMPPGGWMKYCGRRQGALGCEMRAAGPAYVVLDDARWQQLEEVHRQLRRIRQVPERGVGQDDWQVAVDAGDCEDIALAGEAKLLAAGWPHNALRLATAWTEMGQYHIMLTVEGLRDGRRGTWVLDSRMAKVMAWQELEKAGYRFGIRQAARSPYWVAIRS